VGELKLKVSYLRTMKSHEHVPRSFFEGLNFNMQKFMPLCQASVDNNEYEKIEKIPNLLHISGCKVK
jgi:hypothetical protein